VAVTQTGVRLTLPLKNKRLLTTPPALISDYANPGQVLADGTGGSEIVTPLLATPGYAVALSPNNVVLIQTQNSAEYGFTSLGGIYGAIRIRGGGVFRLSFPESFNANQIDEDGIVVEAQYGAGTQYIQGTVIVSQQ